MSVDHYRYVDLDIDWLVIDDNSGMVLVVSKDKE
jgi:hypothetical protein